MKNAWIITLIAVVATVFSLTLVGLARAPGDPARIAFISPNRIIAESPEARAEIGRFQATQQQKRSELQAKQKALEATRRQLVQAGSASERAELLKKEQQQRTELEEATRDAQTDLQKLQQQMQSRLMTRLKPVLEAIAQDQDFQIVLNADTAVVWGSQRVDLTPAVIERLNAAPPEAPKP